MLEYHDRENEVSPFMVPIGNGLPELQIYCSRMSDPTTLDLLWSQVLPDGRAVGALAEEKRREFETRGDTKSS
jgi:hypothetical protein